MLRDLKALLPILGRHEREIGSLGMVCKLFPRRGMWVKNMQRFVGPHMSSHCAHTIWSVSLGVIPPLCCTSHLSVGFYALTIHQDQLLGNRWTSMRLTDLHEADRSCGGGTWPLSWWIVRRGAFVLMGWRSRKILAPKISYQLPWYCNEKKKKNQYGT